MKKLLFATIRADDALVTYDDENGTKTATMEGPACRDVFGQMKGQEPTLTAIQVYGGESANRVEYSYGPETHNTTVYEPDDNGQSTVPPGIAAAIAEIEAGLKAI